MREELRARRIFHTLWELKKAGQSEDTLKAKDDRLRYLAKRVNLDDPDAVKGYIPSQSRWSNAYKQGVARRAWFKQTILSVMEKGFRLLRSLSVVS